MWNSLFKLTLVSYIWKRYRRTLIALPILFIYFWIVNLVHSDIIAYSTLNQDTSWLAWSFFIKWLFIFVGVGVFAFIHLSARLPIENSLVETFKQTGSKGSNEKDESLFEPSKDFGSKGVFDRIRNKDKLRTKADLILEKNKKS